MRVAMGGPSGLENERAVPASLTQQHRTSFISCMHDLRKRQHDRMGACGMGDPQVLCMRWQGAGSAQQRGQAYRSACFSAGLQ